MKLFGNSALTMAAALTLLLAVGCETTKVDDGGKSSCDQCGACPAACANPDKCPGKCPAGCACGKKKKTTDQSCASGQCPMPAAGGDEVKKLDTKELVKMVESQGKFYLVDCRSGRYDAGDRIPGSIRLSWKASDAAVAKALPDKDAPVVAYCSNLQCAASKNLALRLIKLGYNNVAVYPNGIEGWMKAGNKIDKEDTF